jgi:hypothetical protein
MNGFTLSTTFKDFKILLSEDLRLDEVGLKKSKFTYFINSEKL